MKRKLLTLLIIGLTLSQLKAQLTINNSMTPQQLVNNVLIGSGVSASNISYSGASISIGKFSNGQSTNLGMNEGVILSTGSVLDAPGPNSAANITTNTQGSSDPLLAALIPGYTVTDAAILEFDFIPMADSIHLEYVFASEEYPEWVGSSFNDVFGFFVSGANPAGGSYSNYNLATVPGTSLPVTVNNINNGPLNSGPCTHCQYYINNTGGTSIEYDGFTTVIKATLVVTPCTTYHIKIAIGDVGDHSFDSGIFLKSNSFSSNVLEANVSFVNPAVNYAIESCNNAIVSFTLPHVSSYNRVVHYTIGGTATNGLDYTYIPDSITIPTGSDSVALVINPLLDALNEGSETVQLIIESSSCSYDTVTLSIHDYTPVQVTLADPPDICLGDTTLLTPAISNGSPPYTYLWSSGDSSATLARGPSATQNYWVRVSDACNFTDSDTATITVHPLPVASGSASSYSFCQGLTTTLSATGGSSYSWSPVAGLSSSTSSSVIASPATSTVYHVTVTDTNGCQNSDSVSITILPHPSLSASAASGHLCVGTSTTLTASGAQSYLWSPAGSLSSSTGSTVTASPAVSTTYKVIGTGSNGCQDSLQLLVQVHAYPNVSISPAAPGVCSGQSTTLTASGASTYSWSPSNILSVSTGSTVTATPAATQNIVVTGTDSYGCSSNDTVTLTVFSLPNVTVSPSDTSICDNSSTVLSAGGAVSYSWSPASSLSSSTGNSVTATPPSTTNYSVVGADIHGCTDTAFALIRVSPNPLISPVNQSICAGNQATLSASSTLPGTTYLWSTGATSPSIQVTPLNTTTYTVTATDTNSCQGQSSAVVTVKALPVLSISPSAPQLCYGSQVSLTASGGVSYSWSPASSLSANSGATVIATPAATQTYTLIGAGANNCLDSTQVTVTVNMPPQIKVNHHDTIVCIGSTFSLTASGGSSYSWTPSTFLSASNTATVTVTPTADIQYVVNGTDVHGCSSSDTANIVVSPQLTVSASPPRICIGDSTLLSATCNLNSSYVWNTGSTSASFYVHPTDTTTYTVSATDTIGCTAVDSVQVIVYQQPNVTITPANQSICDGVTTSMTASGAQTYVWSPGATLSSTTASTVNANPSSLTNYQVIGTDHFGCKDTAYATINVLVSPTVTVSPTSTTHCAGESTTLTASGASTYSWSPAAGLSTTTGATVTGTPLTTTTYTVVGTIANGCSDSATATLHINPLPVLSVTPDSTELCLGQSATLAATGAATYNWSPAGSLSSAGAATVIASPVSTTTYKLIGTTSAGCVDSMDVYVGVHSYPTITLSPINAHMCPGDSLQLISGGALTYLWSPATHISSTTGDTVMVKPHQSTTYQVIGANQWGCSDTLSTSITVSPVPVISPANPTMCNNDSIKLSVSTNLLPATYLWNTGSTADTLWVKPLVNTTYSVTVTDTTGCQKDTSVTVSVNAVPTLSVNLPAPYICPGDSVDLTASGADHYSWSPAAGLSNTSGALTTAFPQTNTTYQLIGSTNSGCSDTINVTVSLYTPPSVSVSPANAAICGGGSQTLTASGASTYQWSPSTGLNTNTGAAVIATPNINTTYTLIGTDTNGCSDTAISHLAVYSTPGITPNSSHSCPGDTVSFMATTTNPVLSYAWSTGSTTQSINVHPTVTTTYTVTVNYPLGCSKSNQAVANIYNDPTIVASASSYTVCPGDTVDLQANLGFGYSWTPTATLLQNNLAQVQAVPTTNPTVYTVTGHSIHNCPSSDTLIIHLYPQVHVNLNTATPTICRTDTALLHATGASTYLWGPTVALSATTGDSVKVYPTANQTYYVSGTDTNGCIASDTLSITVDQGPTVSVTPANPSLCRGDTTILSASGAVTYSWFPNLFLTNNTGAVTHAFPNTNITYTVTGYSAHNCPGDTQVYVTVKRNPIIYVFPPLDSVCEGDSVMITVTGAGGSGSYNWTPTMGLSSSTGDTVYASPTSNTTYNITGISTDGCSKSISSTIKVHANPVVSLTSTHDTLCRGDTTQLSAAGALTYQWYSSGASFNGGGNLISSHPSLSTDFSVVGTNQWQCSDSVSRHIHVWNLPNVHITAQDSALCIGDSTLLSVSGATTYQWQNSAFLSSTTGSPVQVNPASTASYVVSGTDIHQCVNSDTLSLPVYPRPVINATSSSYLVCDSNLVTLTGSSSVSGTLFIWNTGDTAAVIHKHPTSNTSYEVHGYNSYGCDDSATVSVQVNPYPVLSLNQQDTLICIHDSILIQGFSSITPVNYTWNTGSHLSNIQVAPNSSTLYTLIGADSIGCSDTASVMINVQPLPGIQIQSSAPIICYGDSLHLSSTSLYPVGSYSWNTGQHTSSFDDVPVTSQWYHLDVSDSIGCTDSDSIKVQVNPIPQITVSPGNSQRCYGDTLNLSAVSNINPVNFSWSTGQSGSQITVNVTSNTLYTVVGADSIGCKDSATALASFIALPNVQITAQDSMLCAGDSTLLSASGASTYLWNSNAALNQNTGTPVQINPLVTSTYIVTGTDINNCQNRDTIVIPLHQRPQVSIAASTTQLCDSMPLTLSGQSTMTPTTFVWNTGDTTTILNQNPTASATYEVHGYNIYGCDDSASLFIQVNPYPLLSINHADTLICTYDTLKLKAVSNINPITWTWNTGAGSDSIMVSPNVTTTYTVIGSDSIGCSDTLYPVVRTQPTPYVTIQSSNNPTCYGDSVSLTASTATPVQFYNWSNAQVSPDLHFIAVTSGWYSITVTDSIGCHDEDSSYLQVNPLPAVSISPANGQICYGDSLLLTATSTINPVSFSWSNGQSGNTLYASPVQSSYYQVTVSDSIGCSGNDSVPVIVHPLPQVTINPANAEICFRDSIQLSVNSNHPISSILWSTTSTTTSIVVAPTVNSSYSVEVTDLYSCKNNASRIVVVHSLPQVQISPANGSVCSDDTLLLTATANHPLNNLTWSTGQHSNPIAVAPALTQMFWVTVHDTNNCVGGDTTQVTVVQRPTCTISAMPDTICSADSSLISYSGTGSNIALYNWDFDGGNQLSGSGKFPHWVQWGSAGLKKVILTVTENGCTSYPDTAAIQIYQTPLIDFVATPTESCESLLVNFQNLTPNLKVHLWEFGDPLSPNDTSSLENPGYVYKRAGQYTVGLYGVSNDGCPAYGYKAGYINVHPNPTASFKPYPSYLRSSDARSTMWNFSINDSLWEWDFDDPNSGINNSSNEQYPWHLFRDTGTFHIRLVVFNQYGCSDTAYKDVLVIPVGDLYFPTGFTPNGDGLNDEFIPEGHDMDWSSWELTILNRWGQVVFHSKDYREGWNGRLMNNGNDCPIGVYSYILRVRDLEHYKKVYRGMITLYR